MQETMQAIRVHNYGGPEVLTIETVPVPKPAAGEVLVEVKAAGVNPVDTYIHTGTYAKKPELPYTPGSDGAGIVAAIGEGVTQFNVGQRVYLAGSKTGSYAQYAVCSEQQVYPLPDGVSFAQGAALGVPYTTAWRALFQCGQAQAGERVLVHGATGSVGLAAVQMAVAAGLEVYATGGSQAGRDLVLKQGAKQVFDHHQADYADTIAQDGGVDIIVEMLANVNLDQDLAMLANQGRVLVVGNRGQVEINPRALMQKESSIRGVMRATATAKESQSIFAGLSAGLENGSLQPVVAQEFALDQAQQAHKAVMEPGHGGKIVLLPHAD